MMKFHDALFLASTKFRTRKARNIFSALTMSFGLVVIMVFLFASAGVVGFARSVFVDSTESLSLAVTNYNSNGYVIDTDSPEEREKIVDETSVATFEPEALSPEAYIAAHPNAGITKAYQQLLVSLPNGGYTLGGTYREKRTEYQGSFQLMVSEDIFVQDFVFPGQSLTIGEDGSIPVLVPREVAMDNFTEPLTQQESYEMFKKNAQDVLDTTLPLGTLLYDDKGGEPVYADTPIRVRVVGFVAGFFSGSTIDGNAFIIPRSAYTQGTAELRALFAAPSSIWMITQFETKKQRDDFVAIDGGGFFMPQIGSASYTMSAPSRFEIFAETINFLKKVAFGVGGFLLTISSLFLMSTMGKIISDSKKEIGVFRAVGAHKRDVRMIYYIYAWMLMTAGFILALCISVACVMFASVRWGDSFYYQLINTGVNAGVAQPGFVFLGFAPGSFIALYGLTLLITLCAAFFPVMRASRLKPIEVLKAL